MFLFIVFNIASFFLCSADDNVSQNCSIYKDNFGLAVSDFTLCATSNSHPIKLCEKCVDKYINIINSYNNLSQVTDNNGTSCYNRYVHHDRLEILETMYRNSYDLWNTAKCYECFIIDNNEPTPNRSANVLIFDTLYKKTNSCIDGHIYKNISEMCNFCMDSYTQLSDFYKSISNENENIGMCMDVVDLMNNTRSLWSSKCCLYRRHKEYIFVISTCLVLLLTILFYSLTKLLIDKTTPAISLQTRFAESLNYVPKH